MGKLQEDIDGLENYIQNGNLCRILIEATYDDDGNIVYDFSLEKDGFPVSSDLGLDAIESIFDEIAKDILLKNKNGQTTQDS